MNGTHGQRARAFSLGLTTLFAFVAVGAGCGPTVLYNWGRYEESLQASYVLHDDAKALSGLEATVTGAQRTGRRAPPGVCAEYGFALYKQGNHRQAIEYFEREAQLFPESKPLMEKLIAKVRGDGSPDEDRPSGGDPAR